MPPALPRFGYRRFGVGDEVIFAIGTRPLALRCATTKYLVLERGSSSYRGGRMLARLGTEGEKRELLLPPQHDNLSSPVGARSAWPDTAETGLKYHFSINPIPPLARRGLNGDAPMGTETCRTARALRTASKP